MKHAALVLLLLAAPAMALGAPHKSLLRSGSLDAPVGKYATSGWALDNTTSDMHYMFNGVDWLELDPSGTTLTLSSLQGTSLVFSDALTFSSTLAVTGATTLTGDLTLNGGSGALSVEGAFDPGPWFEVTFNEGAAKGVALMSQLSAAYSTTADAVNLLQYGESFRAHFVTNTTATGTITPAGTATGLDLNAGAPGNSDEWTMTTGQAMASGGMIIPGTTPAWKACATVNVTTVAEAAGLWLLVTTPGAHVDLSSADPNYTSYVGIGIEQTDIVVSDNTTGPTDTTDNAADGVSVAWCILGSAAGVITYTINGAAPTATDAHTLGDGVPHVVRIQGLNHTGTEAPMNIVSFSLLPQ